MNIINDLFVAALKYELERAPRGTMAKLAKSIGISSQTVIKTLKWGRTPQEDERRAIAKYFGCSYDDFLNIGRRELGLISEEEVAPQAATVTISQEEYEVLMAAAREKPESTPPGDWPQIKAEYDTIKALLAGQITAIGNQTSALGEIIAAAIKSVRDEERDKMLAERENRIKQLENDIEELKEDRDRLRTKVEGNILALVRSRGIGRKNAA